MNTLMLVALAVVALCYCGGKYCPKVLKQNKEMVLGVLVGMALCSFAGLKMEGFMVTPECCRAGIFNKTTSVIEWDGGGNPSCDPGDVKSPEYEPDAIKWDERCSNMRTFNSEDGPVRANLSVGGSCSNDNECRRGLTCVDGRCASGETQPMDSAVCCEWKAAMESAGFPWRGSSNCPPDLNCDGQ